MNILRSQPEWEGVGQKLTSKKESIASCYEEGLRYYKCLQEEKMLIEKGMQLEDSDEWWGIFYSQAIEQLKKAISCLGVEAEQILKIHALLLLVRLHDGYRVEELRHTYFYDAVEIARRYLGSDFHHTKIGAEIMQLYLSVIDPQFFQMLDPEKMDLWIQKAYTLMISESDARERVKIQRLQHIWK